MSKNNKDYDNIFKTLKKSHKRLFISVINNAFNKHYPLDSIPIVLSSENYIENVETDSIEERESDALFSICGDTYLIECQSYEDGTMAIRIAEYAFLSARDNAIWDQNKVTLNMPAYTIIYVKSTHSTPRQTHITFNFPNGQSVKYDCNNIILSDFSKEDIIANKLYPFIPYYITRYEHIISSQNDITLVLDDLEYFKLELQKLYTSKELSSNEYVDIMNYIVRIIKHITDGNHNEERLVNIMGGVVEETPSHEIARLASEKIALSMFRNGGSYDFARKTISVDMISDDKLKELMELANKSA